MRRMEKARIRIRVQQIRLILGASCFIRDERVWKQNSRHAGWDF